MFQNSLGVRDDFFPLSLGFFGHMMSVEKVQKHYISSV